MKHGLLKSTLERSNGDVLKAIEQLVYSHNNNPAANNNPESTLGGGGTKRKSSDHSVSTTTSTMNSAAASAGSGTKQPRFSSSNFHGHQQTQGTHHHQHPSVVPDSTFPWKSGLPGSAGNFGGGTNSLRGPLFPASLVHQSGGYFPTAAAAAAAFANYGAAGSFLSSASFLRPDYPVFPGMSSMLSSGGASADSGPYGASAYHPLGLPMVKQESPAELTGRSSTSPRSDRSERSPYSD